MQDTVRNPICIPQPHFIIMLQLVFVKAFYETIIHSPPSFFALTCLRLKTRLDSPDSSTDRPEEGDSCISSFVQWDVSHKQKSWNSTSYFSTLGLYHFCLRLGQTTSIACWNTLLPVISTSGGIPQTRATWYRLKLPPDFSNHIQGYCLIRRSRTGNH